MNQERLFSKLAARCVISQHNASVDQKLGTTFSNFNKNSKELEMWRTEPLWSPSGTQT